MPVLISSSNETMITERLVLRQVAAADANEIFFLRSDEKVNLYVDRIKAVSVNDASVFIQKINEGIARHKWFYWAICLKDDPRLIGTICFWNIEENNQHAEIGYELHPDFQGRGFMNEALQRLLDFGFNNLPFTVISAFPHVANLASIKLLEKNHFKKAEQPPAKRMSDDDQYLVYVLAKEDRLA